ncbi:ribosome maturation factor RimM [Mesorhizobium sp. BAC0120]|uniref:ribosome maturation factor RimM n=1 Tax=Mesorhizobium sp. BAC0120 TaxID=3090670 RepID=UPI00298BE6F1|nr:ribosome maturation factor RimM [Mesorhizobium sp. BAC0120]MDW6022084.1 ribosome maturation factor RimM [Mesorhizobium sp. BAC0120]
MVKLQNPVLMAVIGAAHGIRGELRVKTFTADPLALGDYGPLSARDGRVFEIAGIRPQGNVVVVRFEGVGDRNRAEALTGTELFIDRSALPGELEEEEFYHADLVGMAVLDQSGAEIGKVSAVQNYGAGDILEIKGPGLDAVLVPFTKAAVPAVDVALRRIRVDTTAAGLAEDGEEGPEHISAAPVGFDPKRRPRGPREAGGNH